MDRLFWSEKWSEMWDVDLTQVKVRKKHRVKSSDIGREVVEGAKELERKGLTVLGYSTERRGDTYDLLFHYAKYPTTPNWAIYGSSGGYAGFERKVREYERKKLRQKY